MVHELVAVLTNLDYSVFVVDIEPAVFFDEVEELS